MNTRFHPTPAAAACESWRKRCGQTAGVALAMILALAASAPALRASAQAPEAAPGAVDAAPQPGPQNAPGHTREAVAEHGDPGADADDDHHESPWALVGRIFNFTVLAGTLLFLLRKPIAGYLAARSTQVRDDLVTAARMKEEAGRQIATIEARLKELPQELDALRARGRDEIAAEETRILEAAAAERERLLEQMRREIELQLRVVRRDLVNHAADLAVHVARERIRSRITDTDQLQLVDRYVAQVRTHA